MATRDLTASFLERRGAANLRRRREGSPNNSDKRKNKSTQLTAGGGTPTQPAEHWMEEGFK
jgi:hypothetical protein